MNTMITAKITTTLLAIAITSAPALAQDRTIGALFPLNGPNAVYGDVFMSGSDLAVTHINADKC